MTSMGQSARSTHNFDTIAGEQYDESIPQHVMRHITARRLALIQGLAGTGSILDVGCGTGRLLGGLPDMAYRRYGIDISLGMLRQARHRQAQIQCSLASATSLPYCDGTFDVVFCAAVLHHIAERSSVAQAIREIVRVTKIGGAAVIWDHNPMNPYWPILMKRVPQDIGEERLIPRAEIDTTLRSLQQEYGLSIHWRQMTFIPDFAPSWSLPVLAVIEAMLEQAPLVRNLSAHNVAVVVKQVLSEEGE